MEDIRIKEYNSSSVVFLGNTRSESAFLREIGCSFRRYLKGTSGSGWVLSKKKFKKSYDKIRQKGFVEVITLNSENCKEYSEKEIEALLNK